MNWLDYSIVLAFLASIAILSSFFVRRASKNSDEFIVAGRKLPWWLAGISSVALGFNADSALHNSNKIRTTGIQGAWFYWNVLISSVIGTLLFDPLLRRTRIRTPAEFYSLRYGGRGGDLVRLSSALLLGVFNGVIFGSLGLLGLIKLSRVLFDFPLTVHFAGITFSTGYLIASGLVALALFYSVLSGAWGVVWTDMVEYIVALTCSYTLTAIVLHHVGGGGAMRMKLLANPQTKDLLRWFPAFGIPFFMYIFVIPMLRMGEVSFGSHRLLGIKDERQVVLASFWRHFNHFVLRNWPWFMCGLASVLLISQADVAKLTKIPNADMEYAYPALIVKYMPHGLLGLMISGFFCAFLGAMEQILHTSSSIFVNDIYKPFIRRKAADHHYITVVRIMMVVMAASSIYVAANASSILQLLAFLNLVLGSVGLIQLGRWIWWRVNVWGDLAGQISAISLGFFFVKGPGDHVVTKLMAWYGGQGFDLRFTMQMLLCVSTSSLISLIVMLLTPPESKETLIEFYRLVRPYGWWGPIAAECPEVETQNKHLPKVLLMMVLASMAILGLVFSGGFLFMEQWKMGFGILAIAIISSTLLIRNVNQVFSREEEEPQAIPAAMAPEADRAVAGSPR